MDRTKEYDQWGGRSHFSQSHNLQKLPPPVDLPEVLVPKWVNDSFGKWETQLTNAIGRSEPLFVINKVLDQILSEAKNAYWTAMYLVNWILEHNPKKEKKAEITDSQIAVKATGAGEEFYLALPLMVIKALVSRPVNVHPTASLLSVDIKHYAISTVIEKGSNALFREVNDVYEFNADPQVVLPHIRQLIDKHKYGAAGRAVGILNLYDRFTVTDILFPLVMLNKISNVYMYLNDASADMPKHFVQFLDGLLEKKSATVTEMVESLHIPDVRKEHLSKKHITRWTIKLAKKYQVQQEFYAHAQHERRMGVLMFLIMKRYVDQSIPVEDWDDLLSGFVGDNRQLGRTAIIRMAYKDDLAMAQRCSKRWAINMKSLPGPVRDALRFGRHIAKGKKQDEENRSQPKPRRTEFYMPDRLTMAAIQIVDTRSKFDGFIAKIKEAEIVGMDCEWRPVLMDEKTNLALLQLATKEKVYLLDILQLKRDAQMSGKWFEMEEALFAREDVLKVGFSIEGDWQVVEDIHPSLQGLEKKVVNILDLRILCRNVLEHHPEIFPCYDGSPPEHKGLTNYIEICFGLPLDKYQQFSNWERRPLRESQLKYAALDALCLLDLYAKLKSECEKVDIDFDVLCIKGEINKQPKDEADGDGKDDQQLL